jgi:hypothetical protein
MYVRKCGVLSLVVFVLAVFFTPFTVYAAPLQASPGGEQISDGSFGLGGLAQLWSDLKAFFTAPSPAAVTVDPTISTDASGDTQSAQGETGGDAGAQIDPVG